MMLLTDEEKEQLAEVIRTAVREHQPSTGMKVSMGETCRCGYWTGVEKAGVNRPVGYSGLTWHQSEAITLAVTEFVEAL